VHYNVNVKVKTNCQMLSGTDVSWGQDLVCTNRPCLKKAKHFCYCQNFIKFPQYRTSLKFDKPIWIQDHLLYDAWAVTCHLTSCGWTQTHCAQRVDYSGHINMQLITSVERNTSCTEIGRHLAKVVLIDIRQTDRQTETRTDRRETVRSTCSIAAINSIALSHKDLIPWYFRTTVLPDHKHVRRYWALFS